MTNTATPKLTTCSVCYTDGKDVAAWSADARRNGLWVTGSDEAIGSLKNILRLLDIQPRELRLTLRIARLDPAAVPAEKLKDAVPAGLDGDLLALVEGNGPALQLGETIVSSELPVPNNGQVGIGCGV